MRIRVQENEKKEFLSIKNSFRFFEQYEKFFGRDDVKRISKSVGSSSSQSESHKSLPLCPPVVYRTDND